MNSSIISTGLKRVSHEKRDKVEGMNKMKIGNHRNAAAAM